jgi:enoyl-CoA hydratase
MTSIAVYDFAHIAVTRPAPGVVLFTLNRPERMNATNDALHSELVRLPALLDADVDARAAIVTGAGRAFCVGGDWADIAGDGNDYANKIRMMRETSQILTALIEMRKPLVSAINGPAAGIGLALGLLADISVVNEAANLSDGHLRIGLAAGDHAALIWPLLCSMAKAKRYLLTGDKLTGREAERIGLVSDAVPADEVMPLALRYAISLAERSPLAVELSKRALNHWLRAAVPIFEASLGYEMVTAFDPDQAAYMPQSKG